MYDKAQLLKGLQEGCVLQIINTKDTYGYEIVTTLQKKGFQSVKEGTIYPLLLRLEKTDIFLPIFAFPKEDLHENIIRLQIWEKNILLNLCWHGKKLHN